VTNTARLIVAGLLLTGLVGCDKSRPAGPAAGSHTPTAPGVGSSSAPPSSASSTDRTVDDSANASTVSLRVGSRLRVVLRSTYWQFGRVAAGVVEATGAPVTVPDSSHCIPGGGCGTATEVFRALAPGRARITASRTSCGEAFTCPPGQGSFSLTVVVLP
jgi:hypothetical protein